MKRTPQMELDTPVVPDIVARCVWEDASAWLDTPLPRRWIRELTARANAVYARNPRFRRVIRRRGDTGRDWLWTFMRHWLAALISRRRPWLHARLPRSFNTGHPLPPKPAKTSSRKVTPGRRPAPISRGPMPEGAWAAAAHFH